MTYLYLYESNDGAEIYVGIADSMSRVWQSHNADAEALRERPGSKILQTVHPFSSREDARTAEAIAIYLASREGKDVRWIDETEADDGMDRVDQTESGLIYTNRAGTKSTTVLQPAIYYRPGETVVYEELTETAIVRISADPLDDRPAPFGGLSGAQFSERARKWWLLGAASQRGLPIRRLLAVLKGKQIILGSWDLVPPWVQPADGKWEFVLENPSEDNADDLKGKTLVFGAPYPFQTVGYSLDLQPNRLA